MIDISVAEISDRLSRDAERVCQHLLPGGRMLKGEWICGDITGSVGDSLKVHLDGTHAGNWKDWANQDDHGDLLDLWRITKGISAPEAIRQAKDWLGIAAGPYRASKKQFAAAPVRKDVTDLNPNGRAIKWLTDKRMLLSATVAAFKIQCVESSIVFPCFSPEGILINRSYRTLDEQKKVWQDKGCAPCLFGWQALSQEAFRTRTLLICEGQIDCATWTQWGIPALSIPNGGGQTWIEYEWENIAAFDHIYLSFDMDTAGLEHLQKTIPRLGKARCMVVKLPGKDANACLTKGATAADARKWIAGAEPPAMKGLVKAADLERRLILALAPQKECFTLPFLKSGKEGEGFYPRPGEVTIWTGVTSHGKSTFLNFLILALLSCGISVFVAPLESRAEIVLKRMMTSFFNRSPAEEDIREFLTEVGHSLVFSDIVGYISIADLMEMVQFSHRRYGVTHYVVDSLMRVEGLEEDYVAQGVFLNRLQEFAKGTGTHVHLVAHPRKLPEDGKPGKMDVKGSSLIPNNADNIVAVCKNIEKDRLRKNGTLTPQQAASMYDTEIRVEKQRETGWEGRFLLKFDPNTFAFSAYAPPPTKPSKAPHND